MSAEPELAERLEWFDRPPPGRQQHAVTETLVAEPVPARAAAAAPALQREFLLPKPPWETPEAAAPTLEAAPPQTAAPPRPAEPPLARRASSPREPSRSYRRPLRTVAAGLLTLAVSVGFIVAASSLRSPDTAEPAAKQRPAAAPLAKPVQRPHTAPAKHVRPKQTARPTPTTKAKPVVPVTPRSKPKPSAAAKPAPKPALQPKQKPTPPPAAATLPPFAWSPVAGAGAYDFQLFRDSKLVYSKRTQQAGITVPATWSSHGRLVHIGPGSYRWYVWAIVGGVRSDRAVVQATLQLPG